MFDVDEDVAVDPRTGWLHHPECWGCGPAADGGLGVRPRLDEDGEAWTLTWTAPPALHGPVGRVHGGLLSVPMDCLASWAAIHHVRERSRAAGRDPDDTVPLTGTYEVGLRAETPTGVPLVMTGRIGVVEGRKVPVRVEVRHAGEITATFEAVFVEVPRAVLERSEVGDTERSGHARQGCSL